MLATLGLLTILALLAAVLTRRMSPLVALIAVPTAASLLGGFGEKTAAFIVGGIREVAPVAGLFVFAILYFGIMADAGLLDPIIDRILRAAGGRPTRIIPGTALLALLVHLDGSGAVTFLVTIPAMLPMYERLGMDRRILAGVASLAAGVNFLPWTGPMIRASAALRIPAAELFRPLIPVQAIGLAYVFAVAYWLGRRESRRLGLAGRLEQAPASRRELTEAERALRRPRLFWVNLALTVVLMGAMMTGTLEPVVGFMAGVAVALVINYPGAALQRARVERARAGGTPDGEHPPGRRRVHRYHAGHRHARRDGPRLRPARARGARPSPAVPARARFDAPDPAVRPGLLLPRGPARAGGGRRAVGGCPRSSLARRRCWARLPPASRSAR